jgi:pimeloyl-ACP methyl ester carboxylesterase
VSHGGTPGGIADWPWLDGIAEAAGLGFVSINRPGYGASERREGRDVALVAEDVAAVLDHLGVDQFVSLGVSGGGPHALATGALLPGRCTGVVSVAGLAPVDAEGLDFLAGMGEDERQLWDAAFGGREALEPVAEASAAMMSGLTADLVLELADTFPAVDAAFFRSPTGRESLEFFAEMTSSAFTSGTAGFVDDMLALARPWGFAVRDIAVPVAVWHGELDENVPVAHGRWLVEELPAATGRFLPEHGHISILAELPAMIDTLVAMAP